MNEQQKNKPWRGDYPTGERLQFVVTLTSMIPYGEKDDGSQHVGGAVVGPFNSREETIEFIEWLEKEHPAAVARFHIGSAQLMSETQFKQAVSDTLEKKRLKNAGQLHS